MAHGGLLFDGLRYAGRPIAEQAADKILQTFPLHPAGHAEDGSLGLEVPAIMCADIVQGGVLQGFFFALRRPAPRHGIMAAA